MNLGQMKDMAHTPEENEGYPQAMEQPRYPYGLSLTLSDAEIEKLGLNCDDEDCQVGNYVHLHALAEITGYHKSSTDKGETRSLNIQITHMTIEDEDEENEEADDEMQEGQILRAAGSY